MAKEIILTTDIPREKGYLYYTGTDDKGNLTLCKSQMARGKVKSAEVKE